MPSERTIVLRVTPGLKFRLLLLAAVLPLVLMLCFFLGTRVGYNRSAVEGERVPQMASELNRLAADFKNTQAELVRVNKAAEIDRLAAESVRKDLLRYKQEAAELQRDVEFYRGLMAPDELQRGLNLHQFELEYDEQSGLYKYKVVMTNPGGRGNVVAGSLNLALQAYRGGDLQEFSLSELPDYQGAMPAKLRFRFFQNIEGSFKLPDEIKPVSMVAAADIKDATGNLFRVSYDWVDLVHNY